jgi:hypothetical protein
MAARRQEVINERVLQLVREFPNCVTAYDERVPFTGEQLAAHRETIDLRRQAGGVRAAVNDPRFVTSLYRTLKAWGLGVRASELVSEDAFGEALTTAVPVLEFFESYRIDGDPPADCTDQLWQIISSLGVVENKAKLVAGTKTLHHLLPDLVVPMDGEWTGKFFQLHAPEWQAPGDQRRTFRRVYRDFIRIADQVRPEQYVTGQGWRTSLTKILDNALIGFCKLHPQGVQPGMTPLWIAQGAHSD